MYWAGLQGQLETTIWEGSGRIRKYTQSREWLQRRYFFFAELRNASPTDRERMQASLTGDNELDEENGFPSYGYGVVAVERELLAATHGQIFQLVVKLLELERSESVVELVRGIGNSLRTPPSPETSSGEAMMETHEERVQRYRDSEQCEVSDPDFWATVQNMDQQKMERKKTMKMMPWT